MAEKEKEKLSLAARLAAACGGIETVEKRGENKFHHYTYATAADIIREARKALFPAGIAISVTEEKIDDSRPDYKTEKGALMNVVRVTLKITFHFPDGESISVMSTGEGQDTSDKAINKAKTAALKYGLQMNLLIPTGDDPEDEKESGVRQERHGEDGGMACPKCGNVGSLRQNRAGLWQCWASKGGCETVLTQDAIDAARAGKNGSAGEETQERGTSDEDLDPGNLPIEDEQVEELNQLVKDYAAVLLPSNPKATPAAVLRTLLKQCGNALGLGSLVQRQFDWAKQTLEKKIAEAPGPAAGNGGHRDLSDGASGPPVGDEARRARR